MTLFVLLACFGCGDVITNPSPLPAQQVIPPSTPSNGGSIQSADAVMFCLDSTNTYDRGLFRSALNFAADGIDALVRPREQRLVFYFSAITANSYSSDNDLLTVSIPIIPTPPEPPVFATAVNPYGSAEKTAVAEDNGRREEIYQQALNDYQRHVEGVTNALAEKTAVLRNLNPSVDTGGSDNYGCIARAADRFQESSGKHILILATDLLGIGPQQDREAVNLNGASVDIIFYPSKYATDNQYRMDLWRGYFQLNGAASVTFYDTAQSEIITLEDLLK
ncbi:MAG: hypothetical protein M9890_11475 [Thermomicrobiales bacterium]|nr:hypothetical protein [Thermomicrobiales bacterium]